MELNNNYLTDLEAKQDNKVKEVSDKNLLNICGSKAKIEGKLIVANSIEIDCEVQGELVVDGQILIQLHGYVNADVKTTDAIITGSYEGHMEATGIVQITETGKVNGNIKTDSLIIAKGGIFSGNVTRMSEDNDSEGLRERQDQLDHSKGYQKVDQEKEEEESKAEDEEEEDEDKLVLS